MELHTYISQPPPWPGCLRWLHTASFMSSPSTVNTFAYVNRLRCASLSGFGRSGGGSQARLSYIYLSLCLCVQSMCMCLCTVVFRRHCESPLSRTSRFYFATRDDNSAVTVPFSCSTLQLATSRSFVTCSAQAYVFWSCENGHGYQLTSAKAGFY